MGISIFKKVQLPTCSESECQGAIVQISTLWKISSCDNQLMNGKKRYFQENKGVVHLPHLIRVRDQGAVVRSVWDPVVVCVLIAGVSDPVHVRVLLSRVGRVGAIVPPALDVLAGQVPVRPAVEVAVRAADLAVASPAHLALADVVVQA